MYDDYDQREANIASFLSNKIKKCSKCGRELHYKEKYYYTDGICNQCRGVPSFDDIENLNDSLGIDMREPFIDLDMPQYENKGQENRTEFERKIFNRYLEWQLLREKAEKEWNAEHPQPDGDALTYQAVDYSQIITDERIAEMIYQYDTNEVVSIKVEELISLLWEIKANRGF